MGEAEPEKQRNMVTRSSIKRKPFANLTNIVRKPYPNSPFSQSKRPGSSTASDSSIGSTQNLLISPPDQPLPSTPPRLTPAHLVSDEIAYTQRRSIRKEVAAPLCSSTLGKKNQSSLRKTTNDRNEIFVSPHCSSMEKIKADVSTTTHHMKNSKNTPLPQSTMEIKEKGKVNVVQSSYPHSENTNINLPHSLLKRKDNGKSIAVQLNDPPMKTKMVEVLTPSSGVNMKDKGKTVKSSSHVDHSQKDEGKLVVTPIYQRTRKKDTRSSCPPLLKTASNRNQDDGAGDAFQSKLQTEPPPNKKKRCSSKESVEEYALQDFFEQQRAYFKEIDDFELEVEEVSV